MNRKPDNPTYHSTRPHPPARHPIRSRSRSHRERARARACALVLP